jgi:hypothetical protein
MRCDALHRYTVTRFTMEASSKHKVPRLAMSALMSALLVLSAPLLRKVAVSLLVRVPMLTNYLKFLRPEMWHHQVIPGVGTAVVEG